MHQSFSPESNPDDRAALEALPGGAGGGSDGADSKAADQNVPKPKPAPKPRTKRKLTDAMQTEICSMISVGCSMRTAARLAGCSEAAIRNLSRRDEVFGKRLREASMHREIFPLRNIINASQTHWRAAAWYLSRLNPEEYGYRRPETVTPRVLHEWIEDVIGAIVSAVEDRATRRRLRRVIDRMLPKADRRDEMQSITMPYPYDPLTELENNHRGRRRR